MISLKLDLHVHTTFSGDSITSVRDAIEWGKRRNLDGIAITDHNSTQASEVIPERESDLIVILGEEIDTQEGHLIALGIDEKIPSGLQFSDTLQMIREAGGVAVAPHPFDLLRGGVGLTILRASIPDAIEVINSHSLFFSLTKNLGFRTAKELNVACVGGSDSHVPETIGDSYSIIYSRDGFQDSILDSIRERRTEAFGRPTALWHRLRTLTLMCNKYSRRFKVEV